MKRLLIALCMLSLGAGAAGADDWRRKAEGRRLVSVDKPRLVLEIARGFRALPPLKFDIEDLTHAERRIFVERGAHGRVSRLVIVQFEHAKAGGTFRFRYPSRPPQTFGAAVYRSGAFVFDPARAARLEPAKEAARTRAFLKARGLATPGYWDVARLARVTDPAGETEVIIFYMEPGKAPPAGAETDPQDGSADVSPERAAVLLDRLKAVVKPVEG